jgi:pantothenate kinase type III
MATLLQIAGRLANTYLHANNKKHAAKRIANEANSLVHTSTKQAVNSEIKIAIIRLVHHILHEKKQSSIEGSLKQKDVSRLLKCEMIS